jgi:hypothetical protein
MKLKKQSQSFDFAQDKFIIIPRAAFCEMQVEKTKPISNGHVLLIVFAVDCRYNLRPEWTCDDLTG